MKRRLLTFWIMITLTVTGVTAVSSQLKETMTRLELNRLYGGWVHFGFYYVFDDEGVLKAVQMDTEPAGYMTFRYEPFNIGLTKFIRYGKDLKDTKNVRLLFVEILTNDSATISLGTRFVRADSTSGLSGRWSRVNDYSTMNMTISAETIDYEETVLNVDTGVVEVTETRHGDITLLTGFERGRFRIQFDDGTVTTLIPFLNNDILYMFDLNPRKSLFRKTDDAPTYKMFQDSR